jgi:cation/acetate symporter
MTVEFYTISLVILTFSIYIYIGFRSKVSDTKTFFVADQGIPTIANGAAIAADWMSAASFISMAGLLSFLGYDGSIYLMGWTGGFVLLTLLIAPYLRKYGKFTIPDFIGDRYESNAARSIAAIATIFISLTYVAGQMRGVGIVFSRYLQVDITVGVIIGMVIVAFFAVLGGMKGITWTQVIQYGVLIIAFLIPAVAISYKLTGIPIPQLALTVSDIPRRLSQIQVDLGLKEYIAPFQNYSKLNMFMMTMALMAGTAGLPHVIVRFYTVKTVKAARWSGVWALIFITILYTTAPAIGAFAKLNLIESLNNQPVHEVQAIDWVNKWESTGLLSFNDLNNNGVYEFGGSDSNEVTIDNDIIVLSTPEVAQLSPFIIALVAAGGLAAALSTAAGLLLAMSSAVSHDIYYKIYRKKASEKERLLVARISILATVVVAGYFGIHPPGFVGEVVALAFGIAAASIFPSILLGIFDHKMNRQGATTGILIGLIFTIGMILMMSSVKIFGTVVPIVHDFFGVNAQGVGVIGMILNITSAVIVSRVTAEPSRHIQQMVRDIRVPEGFTS